MMVFSWHFLKFSTSAIQEQTFSLQNSFCFCIADSRIYLQNNLMISSGQKSNLSLPWECGMIRFTAFSNSLIEDGEELFEDFFSIPADTVTRRKAEFYSEFQSSIGVAACQTIIQGKKIDFILSAAADGDTSPSGFPALPAGGTSRHVSKRLLSGFWRGTFR